MHELKRLTVEGVGKAIRKAEQYRLLGEPCEAESICVDVLYSGIVAEGLGKAQLTRSGPSSDDYAIVRWNTFARTIARRGFSVPPDMPSSALVMLE